MIRPNSMAYSPLISGERVAPGSFVAASCQKPRAAATHKPAFEVRFSTKVGLTGRRVETSQGTAISPPRSPAGGVPASRLQTGSRCAARRPSSSPFGSNTSSRTPISPFVLDDAQQRVSGGQHARRRSGVPRPASAAAVAPAVVDVCRLLDGDKSVNRDPIGIGLLQRRDFLEDFERSRAQARRRLVVALCRAPARRDERSRRRSRSRRGCTGRRSPERPADNRRCGRDRAANARRTAFRAGGRDRAARSPFSPPSIAANARSSSQAPE